MDFHTYTSAFSLDRPNLINSFYIKTYIELFTIAQIIDKSVDILVLNIKLKLKFDMQTLTFKIFLTLRYFCIFKG